MTTTLVNVTLPVVTQEVDRILETYPDHPYQQAFAIPDMRQRLIAQVLGQVHSQYVVTEPGAEPHLSVDTLFSTPKQVDQLADWIHDAIQTILQENADWIDHHIPQMEQVGEAPSHWFG